MSRLSLQIDRQLDRFFGFRILRSAKLTELERRLSETERLLALTVAAQETRFRPVSNQALAIERICRLGRLLHPRRALGMQMVRLGGPHDGGYVCLDDIDGLEAAISLGIGGDVSWDLAVASRGLVVYQYDDAVANSPVPHDNFRFMRRKIGPWVGSDSETVASILSNRSLTRQGSAIMKIDIEHDEWEALLATPDSALDVFAQVVCEFHGFRSVEDEEWFGRALAVFAKLNEKFAVVHVHANNNMPLLGFGNVLFPDVLEVSYASRARYAFGDCNEIFPGQFDARNIPGAPDHELGRFVFPA